jgi:hypothetical protein
MCGLVCGLVGLQVTGRVLTIGGSCASSDGAYATDDSFWGRTLQGRRLCRSALLYVTAHTSRHVPHTTYVTPHPLRHIRHTPRCATYLSPMTPHLIKNALRMPQHRCNAAWYACRQSSHVQYHVECLQLCTFVAPRTSHLFFLASLSTSHVALPCQPCTSHFLVNLTRRTPLSTLYVTFPCQPHTSHFRVNLAHHLLSTVHVTIPFNFPRQSSFQPCTLHVSRHSRVNLAHCTFHVAPLSTVYITVANLARCSSFAITRFSLAVQPCTRIFIVVDQTKPLLHPWILCNCIRCTSHFICGIARRNLV